LVIINILIFLLLHFFITRGTLINSRLIFVTFVWWFIVNLLMIMLLMMVLILLWVKLVFVFEVVILVWIGILHKLSITINFIIMLLFRIVFITIDNLDVIFSNKGWLLIFLFLSRIITVSIFYLWLFFVNIEHTGR